MGELTLCNACNAQMSKQAAVCPKCGHPRKRAGGTSMITWIIGGLFASAIVYGMMNDDSASKKPTLTAMGCTERPETAFIMSQTFVKRQLISPSSAKFPGYSGAKMEETAKCEFLIISHVDASNSFGASIRNNYSVVMHYNKGQDNWRATNLQIR
jgi:hypothetical protein